MLLLIDEYTPRSVALVFDAQLVQAEQYLRRAAEMMDAGEK